MMLLPRMARSSLASALALSAIALFACSDDPPVLGDDDEELPINQTAGGDNEGGNGGGSTTPGGETNTNQQPDDETEQDSRVELLNEVYVLENNYSPYIEIEAPENVYSIGISITEGSALSRYVVTDWTGPDGFQLVPNGWEDGNFLMVCMQNCNNRVAAQLPGAFGGLAPNNPNARVDPGTHRFRVGRVNMNAMGALYNPELANTNPNEVRVTVYANVVHDEVPTQGKLDLNLFFSGANGWTASSAPGDASFQQMMTRIDQIYDQVGIEIGEVQYYDIDPAFRIIEDMMSGVGDMAEMFAESSRAELDGPSVFFVNELRSGGGGGGGMVLGISGGIPGPMFANGSPAGGVAIATQSSQQLGAPGIAPVTAHELGHYLGLFHTTEQFGFHDPLPDTPENDPSYLMYFSGSGTNMSEWQGRVMRKNPWVYFD